MRASWTPLLTLAGVGVTAFKYPDCVNGPLAQNKVCDVTASPPERALALVKSMNISEKLVNLVDVSLGAQRLGLPRYDWWSEALHGVAASPGVRFNSTGSPFSYATSFPNTITLAAAFDDDLVYDVADTISTEARAFSNAGFAGLDYWTPNINPYKDPRWGRGHETPGEDPIRIKGYVKALLAGLEGSHPSIRKVIATCKHFAAYDLERWQGVVRYRFNAIVSSQDLSEYYLPPFEQCARDSKVGSFMCSYNALNGTPACASTYLMDDILRKHWNWTEHNNYITSDCNAIQDFLPNFHNYSQTAAQAAADAYNAGTDTVCEVPGYPPFTDVIGAYNQSLLPETTIDRALLRLYEGLIRAGYFNSPETDPYRSITWSQVNTDKAQTLAFQAATDGIVLLKNDGTLPIDLTNKTVALIGHWANSPAKLLGGYSGIPPYISTPVLAATLLNVSYTYSSGPVNETDPTTYQNSTIAAASNADIILYFGGTDLSIAAEDRDRDSIAWPPAQLSLIQTLSSLNKPLILFSLGDQLDSSSLPPNLSAHFWAGYPGQSAGHAIFSLLTGHTSPAGRLPVTQYPSNYTSLIPLTEMSLRPTSKTPGRTYRWFDNPSLPFGYGLHYTNFTARFGVFESTTINISDLISSCNRQIYKHVDLCPFPQISVWVSNVGPRNVTSDYVALVFVKGEYGPKPYPLKTLVGYKRLRGIGLGETGATPVGIKLGDLARVDLGGNRVLYPGRYKFLLDVGEVALSEVEVELVGDDVVLDWFPQPNSL